MKYCLVLPLVLAAVSLSAQEPPPGPPALAAAPQVARWTIRTEAAGPGDSTTGRGPETVVCKAGSRRLEITTTAQGARSESFSINGLSFQKRPGFAPGDIYVEPAESGDFPEFSWVKSENFVGTRTEAGRKFHVYAWTPAAVAMSPTGSSRQVAPAVSGAQGGKVVEAWIDASTRLPAKLVHPTFRKIYTFAKASPHDARPSAEIRARVEACFGGTFPE